MVKLDQFYTKDIIAEYCYKKITEYVKIDEYDIILEPSAGKGAFFKLFPSNKRVGIDLEPKYDKIIKQDFFNYKYDKNKKYVTIGNPPFGKNCSIAVKFFNQAAIFSEVICFIIPRTFKRISIQNQLNLSFNLIYTEDLPVSPCCFEPKMSAKCCLQIWKKGDVRSIIKYEKKHDDFEFVPFGDKDKNNQPTVPRLDKVDFALKAYGSNCGEICLDIKYLRPKSWHFIKSKNIESSILIERFKSLDYSLSKDSCRQDSLGKMELIQLYKLKYEN